MSIFQGKRDLRIKLSPVWIMINFLLSSLQVFVVGYRLTLHLEHHPIPTDHNDATVSWLHYNVLKFYFAVIGLHITSGVLTTILIFSAWLMCCFCSCWLGAGEWRVHDPDNPEANLVWRDGSVVNLKDDRAQKEIRISGNENQRSVEFLQDDNINYEEVTV